MAIGIGETLRAARRERGLTLADAAAATRIRSRYLAALEDEEFEALGTDIYAKGFLRNYARYLGLDPEPLVQAFREVFEEEPDEVTALTTGPMRRERVVIPRQARVAAAGGALLALLAVMAFLGSRIGDDSPGSSLGVDPVSTPTVPAREATAEPTPTPTPTPTATATRSPTATAEATPAIVVEVVLEGGASWMRVTVDGKQELEQVVEEGNSITFEAYDVVSLRLGAPSNVRLIVDGEDQGIAATSGGVAEVTFHADDR